MRPRGEYARTLGGLVAALTARAATSRHVESAARRPTRPLRSTQARLRRLSSNRRAKPHRAPVAANAGRQDAHGSRRRQSQLHPDVEHSQCVGFDPSTDLRARPRAATTRNNRLQDGRHNHRLQKRKTTATFTSPSPTRKRRRTSPSARAPKPLYHPTLNERSRGSDRNATEKDA
jgi:hypothetical protein